jgi:hypothetical protein
VSHTSPVSKRRRVTLTDVFHFAEPDSFSVDRQSKPIYRELNATESDNINLSSAVREKRCFRKLRFEIAENTVFEESRGPADRITQSVRRRIFDMINHENTDDPVLFLKLETELLLESFGEGGPWIVV